MFRFNFWSFSNDLLGVIKQIIQIFISLVIPNPNPTLGTTQIVMENIQGATLSPG